MSESDREKMLKYYIRAEVAQLLPQILPQAAPKPVDEGAAMEQVLNHMANCSDGNCTIKAHMEDFFNKNYKGCPECGKVVHKKATVCKHCGEDIDEDEEF